MFPEPSEICAHSHWTWMASLPERHSAERAGMWKSRSPEPVRGNAERRGRQGARGRSPKKETERCVRSSHWTLGVKLK